MKNKFESILLQLKSNLKSPSVTNELKTDYDKKLHEKLIKVVNQYYENIDLFEKQKDSLQKLLFENANNLLSNTNSSHFNLYLPNYRNYANFLVDNYYQHENSNVDNTNKKSIVNKLNQFLLELSNEKKNIEIKPQNFSLNPEEFNLLTKELESKKLITGQRFLSGEYLFKGLTFEGMKYLEELSTKENKNSTPTTNIENTVEIPSLKFENLPEKELRFFTWKEVHDWAKRECKEWEHWYQYISDMPKNIIPAINIHRGATVRLWSESQKLINNPNERDFKRFSRMAIKSLNEVNESNPIVSYSELGKRMIEAMDNNPDEALKQYQNEFLKLLKNDIKLLNKDVSSNLIIHNSGVEYKFYKYLIENKFPKENLIANKKLDNRLEIDISIEMNNEIVAAIEIKGTNNIKSFNFSKITNICSSYYQYILSIQQKVPRIFAVVFDLSINAFIFFEFYYEKNEIIQINIFPDFKSLTTEKSEDHINSSSYKAQNNAIASFSKANPHAEDKDSLDIDSDIDAFAKLMSFKGLETPLSIGVFGKWGSGKSFFMNKLEKRVNELSKNESFCEDVVHVKFNAWHYSDSNLLASLVYTIFDAIDKDINDKRIQGFDPIEQKRLLYEKLESTAKLLEEKKKKKLKIVMKN